MHNMFSSVAYIMFAYCSGMLRLCVYLLWAVLHSSSSMLKTIDLYPVPAGHLFLIPSGVTLPINHEANEFHGIETWRIGHE
jgi:hypothetical protein